MNNHQNNHRECRQRRKTLIIFAACICLLLTLQGVVVVLLIDRKSGPSHIAQPPDDCRKLPGGPTQIDPDCRAINFNNPIFERV